MSLHVDANGRLRDGLNRFVKHPQGFSKNEFETPTDTSEGMTDNPPRLYDSIAEVMRGYIRLISGVLLNSDAAYRKDRSLQKMMRHDPDVMGPLLQREMAIALLEWNIVAQDEDDESQVKQAEQVQDLIRRNLPRPTDFLLRLADAAWYGPAAVNVIYESTPMGVAPVNWLPFHSDTLIFTETNQLGMKVGARYKGTKFPSWDGLAHLFDAQERRAVVLHTFQQQGPDYDEFVEGRYAFAGRGLRDTVWFQWMMKQKALQLWMKFVERYGMGIRVGRYPSGNAKAKANMETVLQNLLQDVSVTLPDNSPPDSGGNSQYGIEILDPGKGGQGAKIFADLIDGYLAGQIKELIVGQTATTEATNEGLGVGVSTRHAETFNRIIRYDALSLADSLSQEFVWEVHRMNFGETPYKPTWRFALEDVDSEKFMAGVEAFVRVGGVVSQRQVREQLGLEEPSDDEDTLGGEEDLAMGLAGLGGGQNGLRSALNGNGSNGQRQQPLADRR